MPDDTPAAPRSDVAARVGTAPVRKAIAVHLTRHEIDVADGIGPPWIIHTFSTGREGHLTPRFDHGRLSPTRRETMHLSGRYKDAHGLPAAMPYALFFDDNSGCAFHAGNPALASHGCIHLDIDDAKRLFGWAAHDPVALSIRDD